MVNQQLGPFCTNLVIDPPLLLIDTIMANMLMGDNLFIQLKGNDISLICCYVDFSDI